MKQHKKLVAVLTLLCFALTFLPVAAFAAVDAVECSVFTEDTTVKAGKEVAIQFDFDGQLGKETTPDVYVWFVKEGSNVPAIQVEPVDNFSQDEMGVFFIPAEKVAEGKKYKFKFTNSGIYKVEAALENPAEVDGTTAKKIQDVEKKLTSLSGKSTVEVISDSATANYQIQLVDDADLTGWSIVEGAIIKNDGKASIGVGNGYANTEAVNKMLSTNGVPSDDITFKLLDENDKAVKGAKVKLSTNNTHCVLSDDEVTTDSLGQFDFTIALTQESGHTDGFNIYIECGSFEATLNVRASSNDAYSFEFTKLPTAPISTDDVTAGSVIDDYLWIKVSDVNGNTVMPFALQPGGNFAEPAFAGVKMENEEPEKVVDYDESAEKYVTVVSKPAGSDLEDEDVWLIPVGQTAAFQNTMYFDEDLIAGDYTFKITLENGKYNTVSFTVAEMGTPVKLNIVPKATVVELGSVSTASFQLVDANGVVAKALPKGTEVAVSGNGVREVNVRADSDNNDVQIYTKDDDKYAGSEIKIVAMNDRYNLSAETTLYIHDGSGFLMSPVTTGTINTPVDLTYIIMTSKGMMNISTGNADTAVESFIIQNVKDQIAKANPDADEAMIDTMVAAQVAKMDMDTLFPTGTYRVAGGQTSFAVLDKPEGATVNFGARAAGGALASLASDTYAVARVECDTPGEVTLKFTIGIEILQEDDTWTPHIYTGTQKVNFTAGSTGSNVIMSIGSNEIVINDAKSTIDAAPIVENNRTFVPFRALAEAFGATVAYDEATQAVTAELNGTTVVMTIGSAAYTVNGAEKTADVAPFISGSRTMVPVRFAAEAFGIKVTPTYDENGATADILFAL